VELESYSERGKREKLSREDGAGIETKKTKKPLFRKSSSGEVGRLKWRDGPFGGVCIDRGGGGGKVLVGKQRQPHSRRGEQRYGGWRIKAEGGMLERYKKRIRVEVGCTRCARRTPPDGH